MDSVDSGLILAGCLLPCIDVLNSSGDIAAVYLLPVDIGTALCRKTDGLFSPRSFLPLGIVYFFDLRHTSTYRPLVHNIYVCHVANVGVHCIPFYPRVLFLKI